MKTRRSQTTITNLRWGAFVFILLILVIQVMPRAFGQRGQRVISKSTSSVKAPSHPNGGSWAVTDSLSTARYLHTATLLPNGMALVAGGLDSNFNASASAELYDPASGTWTATGSLNSARTNHTATQLPNGRVIAGGLSNGALPSSELYDPTTGTWTVTGSLNNGRSANTATMLHDAKVLVAAADDITFTSPAIASEELYDPESGTWTFTGSLNTARDLHSATLLTNGMVLVAAGADISGNPTASAELYNPATGSWSVTGSLNAARELHSATLLANGMVLVAGGCDSNFNVSASAELYESQPSPTPTPTPTATPRVTPRPRPTPHPRPTP